MSDGQNKELHEAQQGEQGERRKISLQEAMKQKLAQKKEAQNSFLKDGKPQQQQKLKSQLTKKPNNQKRRTGV